MMNVLVVAAHPDDEVLGCGGTIARHASIGDDVFVMILAEGMMARADGENEEILREEQKKLRERSRTVASILAAKEVLHFDFPDNRLDQIALLDVVKTVEGCLERYQPRIVYTHHPGDLNVDHSVTAQAVITAARPLPLSPVQEIYSFEVLSSTEWHFGPGAKAFRPNCFIDIDRFLNRKIEAMSVYNTETSPFPHPRSPEAIEALARRRGSQSGLGAAEAFMLIRKTVS
ncbi:MAG: PIG-L family deacetylase [Deltaproteobacteria bacterium]|nr:PIG-L family deacetylase [Deltaproteobacteria bacterium]